MPHVFSVEIHGYLSKKIFLAEERKKKAAAENKRAVKSYWDGQLLELTHFRKYLSDNIDLKTQKYY